MQEETVAAARSQLFSRALCCISVVTEDNQKKERVQRARQTSRSDRRRDFVERSRAVTIGLAARHDTYLAKRPGSRQVLK